MAASRDVSSLFYACPFVSLFGDAPSIVVVLPELQQCCLAQEQTRISYLPTQPLLIKIQTPSFS